MDILSFEIIYMNDLLLECRSARRCYRPTNRDCHGRRNFSYFNFFSSSFVVIVVVVVIIAVDRRPHFVLFSMHKHIHSFCSLSLSTLHFLRLLFPIHKWCEHKESIFMYSISSPLLSHSLSVLFSFLFAVFSVLCVMQFEAHFFSL